MCRCEGQNVSNIIYPKAELLLFFLTVSDAVVGAPVGIGLGLFVGLEVVGE